MLELTKDGVCSGSREGDAGLNFGAELIRREMTVIAHVRREKLLQRRGTRQIGCSLSMDKTLKVRVDNGDMHCCSKIWFKIYHVRARFAGAPAGRAVFFNSVGN